jgi:hypothetical protein
VLGGVSVALDGDGWIRVGATVAVDEQSVAFRIVLTPLEMFRDVDDTTIRAATLANGNGLGDDVGCGVIGGVDHLGTRVLMLTVVGERDGDDFATGSFTLQDHAGIFHREAAANVAVDPFHLGVLVRHGTFGDEIEDVVGPVLNRDVLNLGAFEGDEFNDGTVQSRSGELGRGAAFHVDDFRAFIRNDERAFKLAEVFRVDAEVGLQGLGNFYAFGNVDEGTAGEYGAVERGEFIITSGDDLAEKFAEDFRMFTEGFGGVAKDNPLFRDDVFDVRVGGLGIELSLHAGEKLALLLGDAETFESLLDVVRNFVPGALRLLSLRKIVADLVEIDVLQILRRPMRRHGHGDEFLQGVEAKFKNPWRLFFNRTDVTHGVFVEAGARVEGVINFVLKIAASLIDASDGIFRRGGWIKGVCFGKFGHVQGVGLGGGQFFGDPIVSLGFKLKGEGFVAAFDDATVIHDVNIIRDNVIEEALVMRDHERTEFGAAHGINPLGDDFEGIDIETGIGLIHESKLGFKHGHLENFAAFLFAAGKAVIDRAGSEFPVNLQQIHFAIETLVVGDRIEFFAFAHAGLLGRTEEVGDTDAGDLARILEGEENAGATSLIRFHFKHGFVVEEHIT